MHSSSFDTENGAVYAGEACGIVVKDGKNVFYHAGDTALFSDLELIKNRHQPNFAFLPIGDRFTMGPKDAACAAKIIEADYLIPIHYKTFGMLTGTLDEFRTACEKEKVQAKVLGLAAGESFQINN
jgi:L-ascorbate metabolism protein UlaG (beta-lactamase superfamily)